MTAAAAPRTSARNRATWPAALVRPAAVGWYAIALAAIVALTTGLLTASSPGHRAGQATPPAVPLRHGPGEVGRQVCGTRLLDSPYDYDGQAGAYASGEDGLPTFGTPGSDFPDATAGRVLPAGQARYLSWQLRPDTVYYLLPGVHTGSFQANRNDAFVGGLAGGQRSVLTGNYTAGGQAIDSSSTDGNQPGVTIEYLTIEKYTPDGNAAAINLEANTGWTIRNNTITLNVPGAGVILGADNTLRDNCLTLNGQYGFQSTDVNGFGVDGVTGGPFNVSVEGNEISYNDTCDFEGLMNNAAIGWRNHNPVPARYRNSHCGQISGDGNQGGFKLWRTNGVTVKGNYIHGNWGPGAWVDTDNANTTITGNSITDNASAGIIEEVSYNFSITNNYLARNNWIEGLDNYSFPSPAIYISESGSDTTFGGVPACAERSCSRQRSYPSQSVISGNVLVDNGGTIFLWQNSNRYCTDGFDHACTLVKPRHSGTFTMSGCRANMLSARVSTATFSGTVTGSPREDWWDGCQWKTENVRISRNHMTFNPEKLPYCNQRQWPDCGAGGIFSEYGSPTGNAPGWATATQLTFFQNNIWSDNTYRGPVKFYAWNQGNGDSPVSWAAWTGEVAAGQECRSAKQRQSGSCTGPFGQDSGSTHHARPGLPASPAPQPRSASARA